MPIHRTGLPNELLNAILSYLHPQDLYSLRYADRTLYANVTNFVEQEITLHLQNRPDTVRILHHDYDTRQNIGPFKVSTGKAVATTSLAYDESEWRRIVLIVTVNGVDISWRCPDITDGPLSQLVSHKLRVVKGFKGARKTVRVSMYLNIRPAIKISSKNAKSATSISTSISVNSRQPPKLFNQLIYIYFLYDREVKKGRDRKNLVGIEFEVSDLITQTFVHPLLFKAN
jgi:hypothetical protein